jgi:hypothetical protein
MLPGEKGIFTIREPDGYQLSFAKPIEKEKKRKTFKATLISY